MVPTSTTADSLPNDISEERIIDIPPQKSEPLLNYTSEEEIIDIAPQVEEPPLWADSCCIYRVPKRLREVNKDAYTPKLISIGPFHHGKEELRDMETQKLRYYIGFCDRTKIRPNDIARVVAERELEILRCYEGIIGFTREDFMKMVVLDSIFIIEHFFRATAEGEHENNYTGNKVSKPWLKGHIMLDLILLENQLPFFILEELYKNFFSSDENKDDTFIKLACKYFWKYLFSQEKQKLPEKEVKHFTDLIRCIYYPLKPETGRGDPVSYVYSATKLYEKGVRFEETKDGRFDKLEFKKWEPLGICQCLINWLLIFLPCLKCIPCLKPMRSLLYLPSFVADNRTEELFRNIMALEQCHYPLEAYLCNYMVLLDHLINTSEDVELLVDKGIIVNGQGSYQEVANMVNRIALEIVEENSCYGDVATKLKNHYKNGCNRNIGYLKSTYFFNLWRGTATVVGLIILGFTLWGFVRSIIK
ncbi:hypothetical protein ACB094_11G122600 [Castanea mollissima]